jgi:trehalose 6-phosphate phosphatase
MLDVIREPFANAPGQPPRDPGTWALFLDLDGTLLDIAPTPDSVAVPAGLLADLGRAASALDGAFALVSGRALADIDRLTGALRLPMAAEHGAVLRFPDGRREEIGGGVPPDWLARIGNAFGRVDGIVIEPKQRGVAIHFRGAAGEAGRVWDLARSLVDGSADRFELLAARMAVEIRRRGASKGRAVQALMTVAPFRGRVPVYVGDDVTDDAGIVAAKALGGVGLKVAWAFGGEPARVRRWLAGIAAGCRAEG